MKHLLLLLFAITLVACGETAERDADDMDATSEIASDVAPEATDIRTSPSNFLSQTVSAVQAAGGDITALSPEAAQANINGWISQLSGVEGADPILEDLARLKKEFILTGDAQPNGRNISIILDSMAVHTRAISKGAPQLQTLASVLEAGSEKLR